MIKDIKIIDISIDQTVDILESIMISFYPDDGLCERERPTMVEDIFVALSDKNDITTCQINKNIHGKKFFVKLPDASQIKICEHFHIYPDKVCYDMYIEKGKFLQYLMKNFDSDSITDYWYRYEFLLHCRDTKFRNFLLQFNVIPSRKSANENGWEIWCPPETEEEEKVFNMNTRKHCQGIVHFRTVRVSFEEYVSDLIERTEREGSRECRMCGDECECIEASRLPTSIHIKWRCEHGHVFEQDVSYSHLQMKYRRANPTKFVHDTVYPHSRNAGDIIYE